jgi:UDPglucose 6-dehydrogenase
LKFEVVSNPEFLAEGSAINDLLHGDRVLIGSHQTEEGKKASDALVEIYAHWMPPERILITNLWSSELSKLMANAFLAQRISSINATSALCEKTDADITEVARAIGSDSRIGAKFLNASIGFGGSCFKKDILNLVYIARSYGLQEVADYWEMVVKINQYQKGRFVRKIINSMFNTVTGKKIAIFGFAFKANTGDTRDTPALDICKELLEEKAVLAITDPKALGNARIDLEGFPGKISYDPDPYKAAGDAHAIAVITEWEQFARLDYKSIFNEMRKPAFIFDGRNILNHNELYEMGYNVYPLGKRELTHFK